MPLQGEQQYNAQRIVRKGFGLYVDITDFTSSQLEDAIKEVTTNPKYR